MTSALVVQFGQLSYYQPGAGHVVSSYYTHRWWENAKKKQNKTYIWTAKKDVIAAEKLMKK